MAEPLRIYEKTLYERSSALLRDLGLALKYAEKLRFLLSGNDGDTPNRPETSTESYENKREARDAPYPGEMWLFVNGVATSSAVIKANGKELARIFQRPIHLVHNPTDGVFLDLAECILGRTLSTSQN